MQDFNLKLNTLPQIHKDRLTVPQIGSPGVKVYNKFFGFIAYVFNFAIKAEYTNPSNGKTKVWYINANSFAKHCVNPSIFTCNAKLNTFLSQVKQPPSSNSNQATTKTHSPKTQNTSSKLALSTQTQADANQGPFPSTQTDASSKPAPSKTSGKPKPVIQPPPPSVLDVTTKQNLIVRYQTNLEELLKEHAPRDITWRNDQLSYFNQLCQNLLSEAVVTEDDFVNKIKQEMKMKKSVVGKRPWALHHFADKDFAKAVPLTSAAPSTSVPQGAPIPPAQPVQNTIPAGPAFGPTDLPAGKKLKSALHALFQWPTDHFPVAGSINLGGIVLHFASYNVLNDAYMHWITSDGQGLNGSAITSLKDKRPEAILSHVLAMIQAGRDFIGLQECSKEVQKYINDNLPADYKILLPYGDVNPEGPLVYNSKKYWMKDCQVNPFIIKSTTGSVKQPRNKYVNICFVTDSTTQEQFIILNCHLQKGNEKELATEIDSLKMYKLPILLMGDMNDTPQVIADALDNATQMQHWCLTGNQATNINTTQHIEAYDQIHLILPQGVSVPQVTATHDPKEIFGPNSKPAQDLEATRQLLKMQAT